MAKSKLGLAKQLAREEKHIEWVRKNLPRSKQERKCQKRILVTRTKLMVDMSKTQRHIDYNESRLRNAFELI